MRSIARLAVVVSLGLTCGCANADLYALGDVPLPPSPAPPPLVDLTATVQGSYCASDPESVSAPVKVLVVLDDSGSMGSSDETFRRLAAARDLVDALLPKTDIYFAVERFPANGGDSAAVMLTQSPAFTDEQSTLQSVLEEGEHYPKGGTPYLAALRTAKEAIELEIRADKELGVASMTRYVVIFMSDGEATDDSEPYDQIKTTVGTLKELEQEAGDVTLHTAHLNAGGTAATDTIDLLREMANIGGGEFRNFENNEELDFTGFDVESLWRDFRTYAPILVTNLNARLSKTGSIPDSDGDGLNDALELEMGTDPTSRDTDSDGCSDVMETLVRTDPTIHGATGSPQHCDCTDTERTTDRDGDMLTDCEERLLGMSAFLPDSDVTGSGGDTPTPDNIIDYLEMTWNLGRILHDAGEDYDADGYSNLEEVMTHTDPNWNEDNLREIHAYRYEYVDQRPDEMTCYDFLVSNISLVDTLATSRHEAGENQIMLYFVEGPQDNPENERKIKSTMVTIAYDPEAQEPELVEIGPTEFLWLDVNPTRR